MHFGFRGAALAFAITTILLGTTAARAGDDGAAPLWVGIGSIFGGLGLNPWDKGDKPPPIEYREHGKIVVPPKLDLPPPGATLSTNNSGDWPVNQETERKKVEKELNKKAIAGTGDARLRYTHAFPNAPVTVRASDQPDPQLACPHGQCEIDARLVGGLVRPRQPQSAGLGRRGQEDAVRSGARQRMANRSAEGISRAGRGRAGRKLALRR